MQRFNLTKTHLLLLLVPLFWGGAFGTTKHAVAELGPLTESALRFLLAGLFMALLTTWKKEWHWNLIRQNGLSLCLLGLTGVFGYNFFFATGLQYTSAITAVLVIVVNPVFTALAACIFMGESWNWRTIAGVTLSLCGVLLVITKGSLAILASLSIGTGELFLFGAVASWVAYTLGVKKAAPRISTGLATTVSTILGAVLLLLSSLYFDNQWPKVLSISQQTMFEMFYLSVFATVVAFLLYNWGIQQIGATEASAYSNLTPINAVWIAVCFYGETIASYHLIGMVLTISGIFLTTNSTTVKK